jgi:hypothetical protein
VFIEIDRDGDREKRMLIKAEGEVSPCPREEKKLAGWGGWVGDDCNRCTYL